MAETQRGRVPASRVLLVACFGAFLAFLDATIVNVASPSIRESFPGTSIGALLDQAAGDLIDLRVPSVAGPVPAQPSRESTATSR